MSSSYVAVMTIQCDKCSERIDYISHGEYPDSVEMEDQADFFEEHEAKGWAFSDENHTNDLCPVCRLKVAVG